MMIIHGVKMGMFFKKFKTNVTAITMGMIMDIPTELKHFKAISMISIIVISTRQMISTGIGKEIITIIIKNGTNTTMTQVSFKISSTTTNIKKNTKTGTEEIRMIRAT